MMSDREDNRSEIRNCCEEDSDEEYGGMKPAYSVEDLMGEENGDLNRSVGPETSEAAKEEDDDRIYADPAKIREQKRLSRSSGSTEIRNPEIVNDPTTESTDCENIGEKTIKSNLGAKSDDDTIYVDVEEISGDVQKGENLVPGQHLSEAGVQNDILGDEDSVCNSEEGQGSSSQSQKSQDSLTQNGDDSIFSLKYMKSKFPWYRSQELPAPSLSLSPGGGMLEKVAGRFGQRFRRDSDPGASEDSGVVEVAFNHTKHPPPQLPPTPDDLSPEQLKRRHIVSTIIESEKSYSAALLRLVEDYERPLLEAKPQIVPRDAIRMIFYKIRDILQCHNMFQIELSAMASNWDAEEKIGDVFTASFSKALVFDVYKAFVVNFSAALEMVKKQARKQTAFAEFLKQKIETSEDRLSLFGLLVKPVQRFPQFIMFLQDLLRSTPKDHRDRLALQLALSELEALTDRLNEAKRESESRLEVRRLLDNISSISSVLLKIEESSFLIRQDDVIEFKQKNGEPQERQRRLFLLNDQLICAQVQKRDSFSAEKFSFHWSIPINEVEVIKSTLPSYTVSMTPDKTLAAAKRFEQSLVPSDSNPYKKELDDLIQDLKIFQSMLQLSTQLRLNYRTGFKPEALCDQVRYLQTKIGHKCNIEHSMLTLSLPAKSLQVSTEKAFKEHMTKHIGKVGRTKSLPEEVMIQFTFQLGSMAIKQDWLQDLQDTKLATDPACHLAWHTSESNHQSYRNPHFHQPLHLDLTKEDSKKLLRSKKKSKDLMVHCATCVTVPSADDLGFGVQYLWICNGDSSRGHVTVVSLSTNQPCVVESFRVCDSLITSMESVPASGSSAGDQVWIGTEEKKIIICEVVESDRSKKRQIARTDSVVTCMKHLNARVFAGTKSGSILVYCYKDGSWNWKKPLAQALGSSRISCLLPVNHEMWVSCGVTIHKLTVSTSTKVSSISKESHNLSSDCGLIECMAKAGVGLLVTFSNRAVIRLYHLETLQHLQDINIASAVTPLLEGKQLISPFSEDRRLFSLNITSLLSGNGLLWVGTNYGFILTLPLPRLEGVPQVKQRPAVSYHAHSGPVKFLASVHCSTAKPVGVSSGLQSSVDVELVENVDQKTVVENDEMIEYSEDDDDEVLFVSEEAEDVGRNGTLMRNQWNSTPDLRSTNDVDSDDDVKIRYSNLLRGVDAEMDLQLLQALRQRKGSRGSRLSHNLNSAVSHQMSRFSETVKRTFGPSMPVRSRSRSEFHDVIPFALTNTAHDSGVEQSDQDKSSPVVEGSSIESSSKCQTAETPRDEASTTPDEHGAATDGDNSDSKSPDEKQPSVVVLPGVTRHVAHSRRFVVFSGGEGYVNWKERKPFDKSSEDICVLHWKC